MYNRRPEPLFSEVFLLTEAHAWKHSPPLGARSGWLGLGAGGWWLVAGWIWVLVAGGWWLAGWLALAGWLWLGQR